MWNLIYQKILNQIIPYERALMTIEANEEIITIPLNKISAFNFQVGDLISIQNSSLIQDKKLIFLNDELLELKEFQNEYIKFESISQTIFYKNNIFMLKVVGRQVLDNNIIIISKLHTNE